MSETIETLISKFAADVRRIAHEEALAPVRAALTNGNGGAKVTNVTVNLSGTNGETNGNGHTVRRGGRPPGISTKEVTERRAKVLAYITKNPGTGATLMQERLGLTKGQVWTVLEPLINERKVQKTGERSSTRYYPAGKAPTARRT